MKLHNHHSLLILLILLLPAFSCSDNYSPPKADGPAAATETKTYQAKGVVKGIDPKLPIIEIDHEDIPGLMPAMQMQFHVKERPLVEGLALGDRIDFTVEYGVGGLKITAIRKL